MIIPINTPGTSSAHKRLPPQLAQFGADDVVLVELQGALEDEGTKDGQLVGKLRVDPANNKPTLMIGHHLLEGKLVNLPKPLAVLHRNDSQSVAVDEEIDTDTETAMAVDDAEPRRQTRSEAKSWEIVAIVKRKMVFSKRPMPIVGKTSSSAPLSRIGSRA